MSLNDVNRSPTISIGGDSEAEGNPKTFKGWALVAFIDLLGFSAEVASSWNDPNNSPLDRLLRIKEAAADIRNAGAAFRTSGTPLFDPKVHKARVHTVFDSIVVSYALPSAGNLHHVTKAMTVVSHGVQMAWAAAIREGFTLRGAIDLGEIYWSESETIGPALISSYYLESKIAKTSRVILGPVFLENLLSRINDDWSSWPSSEWYSVSYDNLIEISLLHLLEHRKENLDGLGKIKDKAGAHASRYDHALEILRIGQFRKANRNDFARGKAAIEALIADQKKRASEH